MIFTSRREKQLWAAATLTLAGIYGTLPIARPLSATLRERGLLEAGFVLAMLLIVGSIVVYAWKSGHGMAYFGTLAVVGAVYLLVIIRIEIPEERTHLIEYSALALLIYQALLAREPPKISRIKLALLAVVVASVFGAIDEGIQWQLPNRIFDVRDILFNVLASALAVGANVVLSMLAGSQGSK